MNKKNDKNKAKENVEEQSSSSRDYSAKSFAAYSSFVVEKTGGLFLLCDCEGKIIHWNKTLEKNIGLLPEEILDRKFFDLIAADDAIKRDISNFCADASNAGITNFEAAIHSKYNTLNIFRFEIEKRKLESTIYFFVYGTDISESKKNERLLKQFTERGKRFRSALLELTRNEKIVSGNVEEGLKFICELVAETCEVAQTGVWLFSDDRTELKCVNNFDRFSRMHTSGIKLLLKDFPNYFETLNNKEIIVSVDAQNDPATKEFKDEYLIPNKITSLLDSAIYFKGKMHGIVCLESTGDLRNWQLDEQAFINSVSTNISELLLTAERKEAELALKESEHKFRSVVQNAQAVIFILDDDGIFRMSEGLDLNKLGLKPGQVVGLSAFEIYKNTPSIINSIQKALKGEVSRSINELPNAVFDTIYSPYKNEDGQIVGVVGVAIDITERKRAEEELIRSEEKFVKVFLAAPNAISIVNAQSKKYSDVNEQFLVITGFEKDDVIGYTDEELNLWKDGNEYKRMIEIIEKENRVRDFDASLIMKSGLNIECVINGEIVYINGTRCYIFLVQDITDRKKAEEAIKKNEEKFRIAFDNAPTGMSIIKNNGQFLEVNPMLCQMFGYSREELLSGTFNRITHPDDIEPGNQWVKKMISGDYSQPEFEKRYIHKDGHIVWGLLRAKWIKNSEGIPIMSIAHVLDITSRKRAEEIIKNNEIILRQIIESSPVAMVVTDSKFTINYVNATFTKLFGYTMEDMPSINEWWILAYPDEEYRNEMKSRWQTRFEQALKNNIPINSAESFVTCKDGSQKVIEIATSLLGQNTLVVFIDVTSRKKAEQLMIESEKMLSVAGLAAGIAHEINNPLGTIAQGCQNIIRRTSVDFEQNSETASSIGVDMVVIEKYLKARQIYEIINSMQAATQRASEIIKSMISFARKSESKKTYSSLSNLIDEVIILVHNDYDLKKKYDIRNIDIKREYEENIPDVCINKTEIQQVVFNIIQNAAHAFGKLDKVLRNPHLIIRLKNEQDFVVIEIEDNGPGMDEKTRSKIFEPFFTTKSVGNGTGLGLSVSYMIVVNNHNGLINVESTPGKGSMFVIKLPLKEFNADTN